MTTIKHQRASFASAVGIVAKREIVTRFLSKSFIISTAITLAAVFLVIVLGPRLGSLFEGGATTIAAPAEQASALSELGDSYEVTEVSDEAAAREAVESEEVDAAVVADQASPNGLKVIALDDAPTSLVQMLSVPPTVEIIDAGESNQAITYLLSVAFGVVWMMAAITFGMSIAQSVVEEKQTRIVEILLATVSSRALLTGKILGNSLAAFTQIALIAGVAFLGLVINGDELPVGDLMGPILWFVVLFIIGFVMIAALYAAAAALVSRQEDLANVQQPIMWLIMLPYFAILFFSSNPVALAVMSYIPFSAPVAVPVRVFVGEGQVWEPIASLAILVLTTGLIIWFAARVYENALLRTGEALKWKDALQTQDA